MKAVHRYILTLTCPDRVGIVATVSELIASLNGWVTEANYHSDQDSGLFFMRNEIKAAQSGIKSRPLKPAFVRSPSISISSGHCMIRQKNSASCYLLARHRTA